VPGDTHLSKAGSNRGEWSGPPESLKNGAFDGRRKIYPDYNCMPGFAIYPGECCAPSSNGPRLGGVANQMTSVIVAGLAPLPSRSIGAMKR